MFRGSFGEVIESWGLQPHQWINLLRVHSCVDYWMMVQTVGGGNLLEEVGPWDMPLGTISCLSPFLFLCFLVPWNKHLCSTIPFLLWCHYHRLRINKFRRLWIETSETESQIFPLLIWFSQAICCSDKKLTNTYSPVNSQVLLNWFTKNSFR